MAVMLETSLGEIVIDLYVDDCPKLCENFVNLCKARDSYCCFGVAVGVGSLQAPESGTWLSKLA